MSECECCGFKELPGILVIHHKDRDRKNNALSNLTVLCPNCHATEHYRENKEGWKHKSNDPRKVKMREEAAARLVSS
jgi:5-methylcytosine-specific restriction endonuclease McrA